MKRRHLLIAGFVAAGIPRFANAQAAVPVVGVLSSSVADAFGKSSLDAFKQGLRESGFEEGHNVAFEVQWAEGKYERLPALAVELVKRKVALIFASSLPSALAVKTSTSAVPVVFVMGADPVKMGVVTSLQRPGGNLTGVSQLYGELGAKRLEMLRELVPGAKSVGVLTNPKNPNAKDHLDSLQSAARNIGLPIEAFNASAAAGIETAFASMVHRHVGAVVIADDPVFTIERVRIVTLAARHRLPAVHYAREFVELGGLVSYGSNARDNSRLAGGYAARILRGEKPSDLPVLQPTKFELVVNLKSARTLGIRVPQSVLLRVDQVIE